MSDTVYQLHTYVDKKGRVVEAHTEVPAGLALLGEPIYFAAVQGRINAPDGEIPIPMKIPLQANSVHAAFGVFDATCQAEVPTRLAAIVEEMKRNHARAQLAGAARLGVPR